MKNQKDLLKIDFSNLKAFLENIEFSTNSISSEMTSLKIKSSKTEVLFSSIENHDVKIKGLEKMINESNESMLIDKNNILNILSKYEEMNNRIQSLEKKYFDKMDEEENEKKEKPVLSNFSNNNLNEDEAKELKIEKKGHEIENESNEDKERHNYQENNKELDVNNKKSSLETVVGNDTGLLIKTKSEESIKERSKDVKENIQINDKESKNIYKTTTNNIINTKQNEANSEIDKKLSLIIDKVEVLENKYNNMMNRIEKESDTNEKNNVNDNNKENIFNNLEKMIFNDSNDTNKDDIIHISNINNQMDNIKNESQSQSQVAFNPNQIQLEITNVNGNLNTNQNINSSSNMNLNNNSQLNTNIYSNNSSNLHIQNMIISLKSSFESMKLIQSKEITDIKAQLKEFFIIIRTLKSEFKAFSDEQHRINNSHDQVFKENKLNFMRIDKKIKGIESSEDKDKGVSQLKLNSIAKVLKDMNKVNEIKEGKEEDEGKEGNEVEESKSKYELISKEENEKMNIDLIIKGYITKYEYSIKEKLMLMDNKLLKLVDQSKLEEENKKINERLGKYKNEIDEELVDMRERFEVHFKESNRKIKDHLQDMNKDSQLIEYNRNKNEMNQHIDLVKSSIYQIENIVKEVKTSISFYDNMFENAYTDYENQIFPLISDRLDGIGGSKFDIKRIGNKQILKLNSILFKYLIDKIKLVEHRLELSLSEMMERIYSKLNSELKKNISDTQTHILSVITTLKDVIESKADVKELNRQERVLLNKINMEFNRKLDKDEVRKVNAVILKKINFIENKLAKTFVDSVIEIQNQEKPLLYKNSLVNRGCFNSCASCGNTSQVFGNSNKDSQKRISNISHISQLSQYDPQQQGTQNEDRNVMISSIATQANRLNIGSYSKFLEFSDPSTIKKELKSNEKHKKQSCSVTLNTLPLLNMRLNTIKDKEKYMDKEIENNINSLNMNTLSVMTNNQVDDDLKLNSKIVSIRKKKIGEVSLKKKKNNHSKEVK